MTREWTDFVRYLNTRFKRVEETNRAWVDTGDGRRLWPIEFTEEGQFFGKLTRDSPTTNAQESIDGLKSVLMDYIQGKYNLIIWSIFPTTGKTDDDDYCSYAVLYAE
jgi:hypothetical protein